MGVLLMLMTIGGLFVAIILLIAASLTKKTWLAKFTLGGVAVWLVFYGAMLLGFSLTSTEKVLANGEAKEYCGFYLDCHMHAAVTGVRTAKTIGPQAAKGEFYIVNVKVFSNARNPNIAFRLLDPKAEVIDATGHAYTRNTEAENLLPTAQVQLGRDIKGSQAIEKEIVFDLPGDVQDPRLDIREGYRIDQAIEAVLVDDEDSLFHKRNYFKLQEQNATTSQYREQRL
jgi:hypothetical protein